MKPYYQTSSFTVYVGDCREVLPSISLRADSCVTDPPYGLWFMGKDWDRSVPGQQFWEIISNACTPGALCLAFGGTRTFHRLAVAIEDAGWEIRDTICWMHGQGFPKSMDVGKKVDVFKGYGTGLKPAYEPIVLAMKPTDGTFVDNALKHGVAGMNVDGCRIKHDEVCRQMNAQQTYNTEFRTNRSSDTELKPIGRFPANLIHDGSEEVLECFPMAKTGDIKPHEHKPSMFTGRHKHTPWKGSNGSASRFFYCAKASKAERNAGCEGLPEPGLDLNTCSLIHRVDPDTGTVKISEYSPSKRRNHHPTVKPKALMEYLCKLTMTPTKGLVLDPFMGSGSTGIGCIMTGRPFVGIELSEEYAEIAVKRLLHWESKEQDVLFPL